MIATMFVHPCQCVGLIDKESGLDESRRNLQLNYSIGHSPKLMFASLALSTRE